MANGDSTITDEAVITEIVQCYGSESTETTEMMPLDYHVLSQLDEILYSALHLRVFALGCRLPEKQMIQVTVDHYMDLDDQSTRRFPAPSLASIAQELVPGPHNVIHAALNRPPLGLEGPATADVVEYAMTSFPASRMTPDFRARVEADFVRYEAICAKGMAGDIGHCYGWVLGEREHVSIDEKVQGFLVIHGWKSVEHFRRSMSSDAFKEALPIFQAWQAPAEVVSHYSICHQICRC
jgi:hypothetical protein